VLIWVPDQENGRKKEECAGNGLKREENASSAR